MRIHHGFLLLLYKLYGKSPSRIQCFIRDLVLKLDNGPMCSKWIRKIYKDYHHIEIGYGSYGGCFNLSAIPPGASFGNYCSIAPNIRIFRANHTINLLTQHPILYNPVFGFVKRDMLDRPPITIGHDVWIGEWVIILPKVMQIGDGAVIGAGSVVTRDVKPYEIVAGNPARAIGHRFDEQRKKTIMSSKWWLLEKQELFCYLEEHPDLTLNC